MAEKESIRLTAGTGEFTRVSGACNGEFGGAAVSRNHVLIVRENLSFDGKKPDCSVGFFWRRKRDSNSRTVSHGYTISSRAPSTN